MPKISHGRYCNNCKCWVAGRMLGNCVRKGHIISWDRVCPKGVKIETGDRK